MQDESLRGCVKQAENDPAKFKYAQQSATWKIVPVCKIETAALRRFNK